MATKVRSAKAWDNWLADEGYVRRHPFARVKAPKQDDTPKDTFTPAEVEKLLASCSETTRAGARDRAVFLLLLSTGLRASEALGLRVGGIDEAQG